MWYFTGKEEYNTKELCQKIKTLKAPEEFIEWLGPRHLGDPGIGAVFSCILAEAREGKG